MVHTGVFLRHGRDPPGAGKQLSQEMLMRSGHGQSNHDHPRTREKQSASGQGHCERSGRTEHGTAAGEWHGGWHGHGRARGKGIVNLPAQGVSSSGGRHPPRRSLAVVSTRQKAMLSALTRMDGATQRELPGKRAAF